MDAFLTGVKLVNANKAGRDASAPRVRAAQKEPAIGGPMHIRNLTTDLSGRTRQSSATIAWEENDYPEQTLTFTIADGDADATGDVGERSADAFLTACFPLAAVHGEARVRIAGRPCPMLVEGLRTAHAWWVSWGGMPTPAPVIEAAACGRSGATMGPRRSVAFLSGGVDGLHMLMRNRQIYTNDDPAYIRDALFIHGFDIGKRARNPEEERYQMAWRRLEPIAAEIGVRLISCRTNLRHLPTQPDFWTYRHHGAALAAVGHAAARGPAFAFMAATFDVANPVPMGSHPAVDSLFSSQRVTIIHDGSRFTRLEKVRHLAKWPTAIAALRVCPANIGSEANCGRCEKCLRTRLELLAAGIEETEVFGPSLTPVELWRDPDLVPVGNRPIAYGDLLAPLRARGLGALCRVLEEKIAAYREQEGLTSASRGAAFPRLFA
jgi:hypothetical protein